MNLQLACTYQKSKRKLQFERLLRQHVNPDQLKDAAAPNSWLYFRRTNPRKFEVYMDEDFELIPNRNPLFMWLNKPNVLQGRIRISEGGLLCIHWNGTWTDCVRFEGEWVEALATETIVWDHYLVAKGKIHAGK
ncbi:MAG: hypothetical protein R8G66_08995 [Cytophagales bacterium]|nr:hypothetical protein [Cytophagales bacterium]